MRRPRGPGGNGLDVTLVPGPAASVPPGFPHRLVPVPWLVAEVPVLLTDRHTGEPHLHADHVYVALAGSSRPGREPGHGTATAPPHAPAVAAISAGPRSGSLIGNLRYHNVRNESSTTGPL
jgi:hypothetical protein